MHDKILTIVNKWHKVDTENDYYANAEMLAWALKNCQFKFYNRGTSSSLQIIKMQLCSHSNMQVILEQEKS